MLRNFKRVNEQESAIEYLRYQIGDLMIIMANIEDEENCPLYTIKEINDMRCIANKIKKLNKDFNLKLQYVKKKQKINYTKETLDFCEYLDINPYDFESEKELLLIMSESCRNEEILQYAN